jgi:hypothetical protein
MHGNQIHRRPFGRSAEGREIVVEGNFDLAAEERPSRITLLIGGQHGDEPATVSLLESFRRLWLPFLPDSPIAIVAPANPDGLVRVTRYNANGVDLNRNCGCNWRADSEEPSGVAAWSEPESRALRDLIEQLRPRKIVSLHWALAEIDADGPQSTALAQAMWDALGPTDRRPYRLRVTELGRGQRRLQKTYAICPGSLGQWAGYSLQYADGTQPAMITLELPYDPAATERPEELPSDHLAFVHDLWVRDSAGYLRTIEPGVHAMLLAACRH